MLFHSVSFLIFFPVVVLVYLIIPKKWRAAWLLVASYYFYMSWNARYAALIALSTVTTFACAKAIEKTDEPATKKAMLALDLIVNLGILFFFKYFTFSVGLLNQVLSAFHVAPVTASLKLLLPVGISFYTFQALGYTIDVYRGDCKAEESFLRYALFVSFFPQLVAGPIERSKRLLSQIDRLHEIKAFDYDRMAGGLTTMVYGLFLKLVIADRVAIIADLVFPNAFRYGFFELLTAATAFAIQIYCDFNAYSTIAQGAARVMGIDLMDNFNTPYFAQNMSDFWDRWHISLSTWFRDYVYIPLGGNRKGKIRKYVNLMITFALSGLWHGAGLSFVAWGVCHGALRIAEDLLKKPLSLLSEKLAVNSKAFSCRLGKRIVTFFFVVLAWVFFRAESLSMALMYYTKLFTRYNPWVLFDGTLYTLGLDRFECNILFVALFVLLIADAVRYKTGLHVDEALMAQNTWFRYLVIIGLIVACVVYGKYGIEFDSTQFIYFTF